MNLPPRQQQILELVRERGYVSIEEMATLFVVTPQTIRRDINQLAEANLLRRYHGGAAYDSSVENTAYAMRADQMRDEKQRIGEAIAAQIPDHASLFINIGTTTESIARALLNHSHLKIITNNLKVEPIFSLLERKYDVPLIEAEYKLDAVPAESEVAAALRVKQRSPVFRIERTSYSTGSRPVDYERLHYRGDLVQFVTRLVRKVSR